MWKICSILVVVLCCFVDLSNCKSFKKNLDPLKKLNSTNSQCDLPNFFTSKDDFELFKTDLKQFCPSALSTSKLSDEMKEKSLIICPLILSHLIDLCSIGKDKQIQLSKYDSTTTKETFCSLKLVSGLNENLFQKINLKDENSLNIDPKNLCEKFISDETTKLVRFIYKLAFQLNKINAKKENSPEKSTLNSTSTNASTSTSATNSTTTIETKLQNSTKATNESSAANLTAPIVVEKTNASTPNNSTSETNKTTTPIVQINSTTTIKVLDVKIVENKTNEIQQKDDEDDEEKKIDQKSQIAEPPKAEETKKTDENVPPKNDEEKKKTTIKEKEKEKENEADGDEDEENPPKQTKTDEEKEEKEEKETNDEEKNNLDEDYDAPKNRPENEENEDQDDKNVNPELEEPKVKEGAEEEDLVETNERIGNEDDEDLIVDNQNENEPVEDLHHHDEEKSVKQPTNNKINEKKIVEPEKPSKSRSSTKYETDQGSSGSFVTYFLLFTLFVVVGYLILHNKNKLIGYLVEGRRSKTSRTGSRPSHRHYEPIQNVNDVIDLDQTNISSNK